MAILKFHVNDNTDEFLPFTFPFSLSDLYFPQRRMLGEMWSQSQHIYLHLKPLSSSEILLNHEIRMKSSVDQI